MLVRRFFFPLLALCFCTLGCSSTITQSNFEKIRVGMTIQEVEGILGKESKNLTSEEISAVLKEVLQPPPGPDGKTITLDPAAFEPAGAKGIRWGNEKKSITVIFLGERVNRTVKKGF